MQPLLCLPYWWSIVLTTCWRLHPLRLNQRPAVPCFGCCLQILFATDVLAEAEAAAAAGWRAVLVSRPGNKPLPEEPGFRVIESMAQLLSSS